MSESPPTSFFQQPLSASIDISNNRKVLHCEATGSPSPVYQWIKNGQPLSSTNTSDIALVIPRIQQSDTGDYRCIASNSHGSLLSRAARVNVACKCHLLCLVALGLKIYVGGINVLKCYKVT